jgi:phospholipase/carboxylesterase
MSQSKLVSKIRIDTVHSTGARCSSDHAAKAVKSLSRRTFMMTAALAGLALLPRRSFAADTKLDGPRLEPASGKAKQLVIFLHGWCGEGQNLLGLGKHWREVLPDAAFSSPNAPEACGPEQDGGYQWYEGDRWAGATKAAPGLNAFIDSELAALGLNDDALALVGFSQGAMMALHVGLRRTRKIGAIIAYSGLLIEPGRLAGDIASRPPVLLVQGDADTMLPANAMSEAEAALKATGVPVEAHICPGAAHEINEDGLNSGCSFLAKAFIDPL